MPDETQSTNGQSNKDSTGESKIWGVSIRGWIVVMVIGTVCCRELAIVIQAILQTVPIDQIKEPFYGVVMGLIGFYFGQQKK